VGLAEDVQLRASAVAMMSRAKIVSTLKGGPYNVETDATFQTIDRNGVATSGSLKRLRGSKGYLRQDVVWGEYRASMVGVNLQVATIGAWDAQPYAVLKLLDLVPFSVGEFDTKDVVREIRYGGTSTCVVFETIEGESREPGDLCFSNATGSMIGAHAGGETYEYSGYREIGGALMPSHIDYHERNGFSMSLDINMTKLDTLPQDAFAFPAEAKVKTMCHRFSEPTPLSVPPPVTSGGDGTAVALVSLQIEVNAEGMVTSARIIRSDRPELNGEAVRTVQAWRYQPGICDGKPSPMTVNVAVPFQGR
jgi:TonB family protein